MTPEPPTSDAPWPVSLLAGKVKEYIDRLGTAWVEGELIQWNVRNGNVYGKLKDLEQDVTISINIWSSVASRLDTGFKQGDRVIAAVKPDYWLKGGTLSMVVYELRHVGLGDLLERLERLKRQLASEGLFEQSRKKPLPFLPHLIGLVTGKDSDAEKDVIKNALLRWPAVQFRTVHAAVQGDRSASEVTAAITRLDADPEVDVIIVASGGGDFQNLLPFSDEALVRAAAETRTPLVSAIGHENDHPLLDDVADLRASTPTDAAKRVVPDVSEELVKVQQARTRLQLRVTGLLNTEIDRLAQLRTRPALATTSWIVDTRAEEITRYVARGAELAARTVERAETSVRELTARLRTLSPQSTLDRGYAIVQADGHVLKQADAAPDGTALVVTLADGALDAVSAGPHDRAHADEGSGRSRLE
ncbi:MAG TPA: exodeoxyribonuclease VII large subunit [Gryllotalpicola sp.]